MIAGKALCLLALVVVATAGLIDNGLEPSGPEYRASFGYGVSIRVNVKNHVATGSILSNTWVLTTALHVHKLAKTPNKLTVWAGANRTIDGVRSNVLKVVAHPKFVPKTFLNDIALLQVTPMQFNRIVWPAKLPTKFLPDSVNSWATIYGWGPRYVGDEWNPVVYVQGKWIIQEWCRKRLSAARAKLLTKNHLCAEIRSRNGDASTSTSSGNAYIDSSSSKVIEAMTSIPNARYKPEIYIRIWPYVQFIRKVTGIRN